MKIPHSGVFFCLLASLQIRLLYVSDILYSGKVFEAAATHKTL